MRTTLVIDEDLIDEAKEVSGAKTKKETIEKALREFIRKRRSRKLLDLEGKVELSYKVEDLIKRRRKDVPHLRSISDSPS
jgi:Arc/MetJ family transcription regulator